MSYKTEGNSLLISAPYNQTFINELKDFLREQDIQPADCWKPAPAKLWEIPARFEEAIQKLLMRHYPSEYKEDRAVETAPPPPEQHKAEFKPPPRNPLSARLKRF